MNALRRILIAIGIVTGILIVGAMEGGFGGRGIVALIVSFLAAVGGLWVIAYATRNEAPK